MTRLRVRPLAFATAALLLLSVLGLVTVDPDDGSTDVLAAAAAATTRTGSAKLEVTSVSSSAGNELRATAAGVVDFGSQRSSSTITAGPLGKGLTTVTDGAVLYIQASPGSPFVGAAKGKPWVALDLTALGEQVAGLGSFVQPDPAESLRALAADGLVDDVENEGPDEVRGVHTTRYSGTVDTEKVADRMSKAFPGLGNRVLAKLGNTRLRVSVWVSDDGLVRRFSNVTTTSVREVTITSTVTTDYFDFGEPVDIAVPPADQVERFDPTARP